MQYYASDFLRVSPRPGTMRNRVTGPAAPGSDRSICYHLRTEPDKLAKREFSHQ
jgi:hypothetical protein